MPEFKQCPKCDSKDFHFRLLRGYNVSLSDCIPQPADFSDAITAVQCADPECEYILPPQERDLFEKHITWEEL